MNDQAALERVVVVGGGLAGHIALTELRSAGYEGSLSLLTDEDRLPYDRPPLSKEFLSGSRDDTSFVENYDDLDVDVVLRCRVQRLARSEVHSTVGVHPFDGLLLATGSRPIRLAESYPPNVFDLRSMGDAIRLRDALATSAHVVVVGAGWLGAEVATVAAASGCKVMVLDAAETPLARVLPIELGAHVVDWYREQGIDLRLNARIENISCDGLVLNGGERLAADILVIAVGARPNTSWLEGSDVRLSADGAVQVNSNLQTSQPGVFAAGDIICWPSARFETQLRLEHWDNAVASGRVAARNLLGQAEAYNPVPYFWSDQLGRRLQYVGHHTEQDRLVFRGDPLSGEPWGALWLRDNTLQAMFAVNAARDIAGARLLIERGSPIDTTMAADRSARLADALIG